MALRSALALGLRPASLTEPLRREQQRFAIAEDDKVAISWTAKGTHRGEIKLLNLPATEKSVSWTGIIIYRIAEGKVVEERGEEDALGLLQQLGLIPKL